jgi:hypothetical protein
VGRGRTFTVFGDGTMVEGDITPSMLVLIDINLHFNISRFREKLLRQKGQYRDSKYKRNQRSHMLYESPLSNSFSKVRRMHGGKINDGNLLERRSEVLE